MPDNERVVINSDEEAREVVQKRADAYEHTVQKASSLLQLIIGALSVIAALAAAGLLTEVTASIFDPQGINNLTTNEVVLSFFSFLILLLIFISGVLGMVSHLLSVLSKSDYPGVISPDRSISYQTNVGSSDNGQADGEGEYIQYSTWLIRYACGKTKNESPLNKVQHNYRVAVYSGVTSMILFFISILLLSYLFEGFRGGLLGMNISIIVLVLTVLINFYNYDEYILLEQDIPKFPIMAATSLLIISALLSGGAAWYSAIELYQQYI